MAKADKLDLFKKHKDEYAAGRTPVLVTVGAASYLGITGRGKPGGEAFQAKTGALYAAAYTIKFAVKPAGRDYKVAPLEGLYWADDAGGGLFDGDPTELSWQLLIRQPEFITPDHLADAIEKLLAKGKGPEVRNVELVGLAEGPCVQVLHVGPYDAERETIEAMAAFAAERGLAFHGRHHEVYLSDPRRVAPERLRTILRHPVRPVAASAAAH